MSAPTFGQALDRPHNGFSALRLVLAVAVVVSHAFSVGSGDRLNEPLARATGYSLGAHAVNGFFAVSGFLVVMSLERRGPRAYAVARALRILPGVFVATLMIALVLGPALTRLPVGAYFADPGPWRFIGETLTRFKSNIPLPGVFADNPYRMPLGTVWTLKYEVLCYLGLLVVGLAGLLRPGPALALVAALALGFALAGFLYPDLSEGAQTRVRLALLFTSGAALYLWRDRLRHRVWPLAVLALAAALFQGTPPYRPLLCLAEAYGAIWLALSPALARPAFEPRADLSYGIYLYGWPIQQSLQSGLPGASPWLLLPIALALTGFVALVSWIAVERPALRLKARMPRARQRRVAPS
ncbi:acyltransferase family protein [Methylobacterium gossipiicola]|uniref:Peptidoglycan/LPS O-acetylase OafA/YrhL, contains acyltransferase and SGNH-hydrolase domains n=1 Tax=Methylobacterium gossipiicola TaxID=582675 RepID=A0A1I2W268_9HYPH|nr:acyltransferase [Methylobacterium gossipiicola]SFG95494.1 Peptidoglycan/LPS O-acetylase OafA/YrhL, contains acyltransferase and SGNH-hydrolase domains [Methylobacterium gossipiicola]